MGNFGSNREIYGGSAREKNTCVGGLIDGGQVGELWAKRVQKGSFWGRFSDFGDLLVDLQVQWRGIWCIRGRRLAWWC